MDFRTIEFLNEFKAKLRSSLVFSRLHISIDLDLGSKSNVKPNNSIRKVNFLSKLTEEPLNRSQSTLEPIFTMIKEFL